MANPFDPDERWLNPNEYSVRRELINQTTERGPRPARDTTLPSIFEDAHPWALQWGGTEVWEGRFYATKDFNAGAQKIMENAGKRLTAAAGREGMKIRATVAVTRRSGNNLNLVERATYKFEVAKKVGTEWKFESLGEITLLQSFDKDQMTALEKGTLKSSPTATVLEYSVNGKAVTIDTKKVVRIPTEDVFVSIESKLAGFIEGVKRSTPQKQTTQGKEIKKAEKEAIRKADEESAARTHVPDPEPNRLTDNKAKENTGVKGGRPTDAERATTHTPPPASTPPQSTKDRLSTASREAPSSSQLTTLETELSRGRMEVSRTSGNGVKVVFKTVGKAGRTLVGKGIGAIRSYNQVASVLQLLDDRIPVLDPNVLIEKELSSQVAEGVQRGVKWLNKTYPPLDDLFPADQKLGMEYENAEIAYQTAREQLEEGNGRIWEAALKAGKASGGWARDHWDIAHKKVLECIKDMDSFSDKITERSGILAGKVNELDWFESEIEPYRSALYQVSQELEHLADLALRIPGGYSFGLGLFQWSQFVYGLGGQVGGLTNAISDIRSTYNKDIEKGGKVQDDISALIKKWGTIVATADSAAR